MNDLSFSLESVTEDLFGTSFSGAVGFEGLNFEGFESVIEDGGFYDQQTLGEESAAAVVEAEAILGYQMAFESTVGFEADGGNKFFDTIKKFFAKIREAIVKKVKQINIFLNKDFKKQQKWVSKNASKLSDYLNSDEKDYQIKVNVPKDKSIVDANSDMIDKGNTLLSNMKTLFNSIDDKSALDKIKESDLGEKVLVGKWKEVYFGDQEVKASELTPKKFSDKIGGGSSVKDIFEKMVGDQKSITKMLTQITKLSKAGLSSVKSNLDGDKDELKDVKENIKEAQKVVNGITGMLTHIASNNIGIIKKVYSSANKFVAKKGSGSDDKDDK